MIKITNFRNFETVDYALPLITGQINGSRTTEIEVNYTGKDDSRILWPVVMGKFKVLVNLKPGRNYIVLKCDNHKEKELTLIYKPLSFRHFVRLVYITCSDSDTFQSPLNENNSVSSACDRISLGAQMIQSFTSAKLESHSLQPKTFRLEEVNGKAICHVFRSTLCLEDALKMNETELWEYFAVELMKSPLRQGDDCRFLGVLSFTRYINDSNVSPERYNDIKFLTKGYVALATGGLALVGSACLHTWPSALREVPWRFGDCRKIDRMKFMDDSLNRGYYWACYATSLGAMVHELGHIFDLGHTSDGIMSRGFDNIHKFFIIDLFYCTHPYQKKYNPYYQVSSPEQNASIQLTKSPTLIWTIDKTNLSKEDTISSVKLVHQSIKSKPPWRLPDPPDEEDYRDEAINGSFWSRSSAIILRYHKFFNNFEDIICDKISNEGSVFISSNGIRIMEFRDEDGTAFYHFEYLNRMVTSVDVSGSIPETSIPSTAMKSTVFVEDSTGQIMKRSFDIELLKCEMI